MRELDGQERRGYGAARCRHRHRARHLRSPSEHKRGARCRLGRVPPARMAVRIRHGGGGRGRVAQRPGKLCEAREQRRALGLA